MEKVLLHGHQHDGRYVAFRSPDDLTVVGDGASPAEALEKAAQAGVTEPTLLYVPENDEVFIS